MKSQPMLFSSICACLIHRKDDSYYISMAWFKTM
jgi:hypothetical protein